MSAHPQTLLLTRSDVERALPWEACIAGVEEAFRIHAEGRSLPPGVLAVPSAGGGFHVKAAGLTLQRSYFAAKANGNFPDNPRRNRLPAIQGVIVLCDAEDGRVLALMDSMEVTLRRTAAASAVAARRLARPESEVVTVCGCGAQGRAHLRALSHVLPVRRAFAFDVDREASRLFARQMSAELGIEVVVTPELAAGTTASDVCVTCTPSREAFLRPEHVRAGTFVAAVGADAPNKQEVHPALLAAATVVVDVLDQCAESGDLHHALARGAMTRGDVHAELADLVTGRRPGRIHAEQTFVFDSTGTALEDVAAAALVYENATAAGAGTRVALGG